MRLPALAITAALLAAVRAPAATLLFVDSAPGDPLGSGRTRLLTPAEGMFTAWRTYDNGVDIRFTAADFSSWWEVTFFPPSGETLAPGSYTATSSSPSGTEAGLSTAASDGGTCYSASGTFVVHEADFALDGSVRAFAADFERRCDGVEASLRGAVRIASGDTPCAEGVDGIPCDDLNPCTSDDGCQDGVCTGTDAISPRCAIDACYDPGLCSPATGTCTGTPADCDDGNPCTADRCEVTRGCVSEPIAGCWNIAGRGVVSASATASGNGRTVTCSLRCQTPQRGALLIGTDGTYREPTVDPGICPSGQSVDLPDEVGRVVQRRHGRRLLLRPTNRREIVEALRRCTGYRLALKRYVTSVRLDPEGTRLTGTSRVGFVIPGTYPTNVGITVRFTGALAGEPDPLRPPRRHLQTCSPNLSPVCVVH